MKKIVLLCVAHDRDATLRGLGRIGVLHLEPAADLRPAGGPNAARQELDAARAARAVLEPFVRMRADAGATEPLERDEARSIPGHVAELAAARKGAQERREQATRDAATLDAFGEFDPAAVAALTSAGVHAMLVRVPEGRDIELPADVFRMPVAVGAGSRIELLISPHAIASDAEQVPWPAFSTRDVRGRAAAADAELSRVERELARLAAHAPALAVLEDELAERVAFHEARAGMGESGVVAYLQGYCPINRVDDLKAAARQAGWGLLVEDPAGSDAVPTLVRYPVWVLPIKAVFDALKILPGYREADIGAVFLPFFSVFFAMLIGDAGYGALLLIGTLWAHRRFRRAPAYVFGLFYLLSGCAIAWGLATGSVFGVEALPAPLAALRVPWLGERNNLMKLCFLLGAVHLTIAHVWNAVALSPSPKLLAQIGWAMMVWFMFFGACRMVLGQDLPVWAPGLFVVGLLLIALFMTDRREFRANWIDHAMLPLSIVSAFVDVVSYVRLFAVGMAALAVAQSFNGMAHAVGLNRVWALPLSAAILLIGHGLNIALSALGVLVHGVRLNTLEFSLHKNMQWSGAPYAPFKASGDRGGRPG